MRCDVSENLADYYRLLSFGADRNDADGAREKLFESGYVAASWGGQLFALAHGAC